MQRKSANQKHQSKANIPSESIDFVQSSPNIPSKTNLAKTTQGRNQDLRFLADICGFLLGFCARFAGWFCDEKKTIYWVIGGYVSALGWFWLSLCQITQDTGSSIGFLSHTKQLIRISCNIPLHSTIWDL